MSGIAFAAGEGISGVAPMESPASAAVGVGAARAESARLKLEELNWDHSFVRELPGDPRTDKIPREVSITTSAREFFFILFFLLFFEFLIGLRVDLTFPACKLRISRDIYVGILLI